MLDERSLYLASVNANQPMNITQADRDTIRTIIEQQLQAFQRNDAECAFAFASPGIQAQFGTPENFMVMVKTAYKAVYRPRSVVFEEIVEVEGLPAQTVMLMEPDGELVRAIYLMQQQPDLDWRIHGCFLLPFDAKTDSNP